MRDGSESTPIPDARLVDEIFQAALEVAEAERGRFLDEKAENPAVRARVEQLLALEEASDGFLEAPTGVIQNQVLSALAEEVAPDGADEPDRAGERLGAYRMVRPIGRGGMASVWLAERADGAWSGEVAIKLIRRGLDTADVLSRFRAERQILSSLSHPGICRLLDGGETEDHQPYLVMELVDGRPITEHCDQHALGVADRVRLFLDVADAVASAHGSMVVHRDLKPSNILVDTEGRVKLLDFGIAKLLDPEQGAGGEGTTRHESRMLTPEYASPEQLRGEPVTALSDTFQLGVLLYRLLTLQSPFPEIRSGGSSLQSRLSRLGGPVDRPSALVRRSGVDDTERFAAATGASPDRLGRSLEGDLDLILLKALDEDPDQRYRGVSALVRDLEAYLEGHPVAARPPSLGYRFGKFTQRNPWVVPTAAVLTLLVGAYVTSLVRSSARIAEERDRAQQEAQTAGEVTDFLVGLFGQASPYVGGSVDTPARELLDAGAARLIAEPVDDPIVQARLVQAVAKAYLDFDLAKEAADLLDEAFAEEGSWDGIPEDLRLTLVAMHGHTLVRSDRYEDARAKLSAARAGREARGESGTPEHVYILASLSEVGFMNGDAEEALALSELWLPMVRALDDPDPNLVVRALDRQFHLADPGTGSRDTEALVYQRVEIIRSEYGELSPLYHHALDDLVTAYNARGAFAAALPIQMEAYEVVTAMFGEDNATSLVSAESLASLLGMTGEHDEALELQRRVLEGRLEILGAGHIIIPITRMRLARHLRETGDPDAASTQIELALPPTRQTFGEENVMTARMLEELGMIRWAQGRLSDAEARLREAGDIFEGRYEPVDVPRTLWDIEWSGLLSELGRGEEAAARLVLLIEALEDTPDDRTELRARVIRALVDVYRASGDLADAERWERELAEQD